jgi:hypothetical protein
MAKYLLLWEVDSAKVPTATKDRGTAWLALVEMVKADMKKGVGRDWGAFPGELKGYAIDEGTEVEIVSALMQYAPYVKFEVHPIVSIDLVEQAIKASMK